MGGTTVLSIETLAKAEEYKNKILSKFELFFEKKFDLPPNRIYDCK
jgi:hypothetical protein